MYPKLLLKPYLLVFPLILLGVKLLTQLMKRLLFPHEAWERGPMSSEDMIVLSGLDEIVASKEVDTRLSIAWPTVRMIYEKQWQHGGFLLEPDPHNVVARMLRFVSKA